MSPSNEGDSVAFNEGDKVHIMRGQHRGKSAEVMGPASNDQYPVRTEDGTYLVVNAVNVKAPDEGSIGAGRLAAELQTAVNDADGDNVLASPVELFQALVSRLESDLPGLGGRISWPAETAVK